MRQFGLITGFPLTLWGSDELRLRIVPREEAARFFVYHPHLHGLWDRHAPLGALGRLYLRSRADESIVRWGLNAELTGSVYVLEKYEHTSGSYLSVGISGWWKDLYCWPETVKFRWQSVARALGRGLGQSLVTLSAQAIWLECPQARFVSESCPAWNRALIRFYQRLGFERWADPDQRGVGVPFVPTVSLRLPLASLPASDWTYGDKPRRRTQDLRRPMGDLKFVLEPDPRYGC